MDKQEISANQEVLTEFRQNIRTELDLCDAIQTPFVCANIGTEDGYKKIEQLICAKVIDEKITIGEAIVQIETDLNPQSYIE